MRPILLLFLAACGNVTPNLFDAPPDQPDAPRPVDARAGCDLTAPFGAPVPLDGVNGPNVDEDPWLTADELTIYFSSNRAGSDDLYVATRPRTDVPFSAPGLVANVNTSNSERNPTLTADGLSLYAMRSNGAGWDIVSATRASTASTFGALALVPVVNGSGDDNNPFVAPDGSALYFTSVRGGSSNDLYRATKNGSSFDAPVIVAGTDLTTPSTEGNPVVSADQLTLLFFSNRPGGAGNADMYQTTRPSALGSFEEPSALSTLNTAENEWPGWISADACRLYFTRGTGSSFDIYVASR